MSIIKREVPGLERVEAVEGEIREFVRRDVAGLRQHHPENDGKIVETISTRCFSGYRRARSRKLTG